MSLEQELKETGSAPVIVVLKRSGGAAAAARRGAASPVDPSELKKHFHRDRDSQPSALATALRASAGTRQVAPPPLMYYYANLGIMMGVVDRKGLAGLRSDSKRVADVCAAPQISLIRPTRKAAAALTTSRTWGLEALKVEKLWDKGFTGKGILVGHLDTGADGTHAALKTAIAHFAEFDRLGRQKNPAPAPHDTDDHGTHTAATIAGRAVGGKSVGVAPEAMLASAIVIEGGQVVARILGGMDWALSQGVQILNMSLGLRGVDNSFLPLTRILRAQNVLPVFAVGNEGPGTSRSPGNYAEAMSVGASNENLQVADFSSSRRFTRTKDPVVPDLVGPGVDIISAKPGGGFQAMDGTSMATPHIAGLAAVLMQAKPAATAANIEKAIFDSCKRAPGVLQNRANRGFPDGPKALSLL